MALSPRLDARLTLESPVRSPDGGGGWTLDWTPVGHLWGEIAARSARERAVGTRPTARITHRITIRRGPSAAERPRPDQRLRHRDRIFAIHGVAEAEPGGAWLTLWVEEGPFS